MNAPESPVIDATAKERQCPDAPKRKKAWANWEIRQYVVAQYAPTGPSSVRTRNLDLQKELKKARVEDPRLPKCRE